MQPNHATLFQDPNSHPRGWIPLAVLWPGTCPAPSHCPVTGHTDCSRLDTWPWLRQSESFLQDFELGSQRHQPVSLGPWNERHKIFHRLCTGSCFPASKFYGSVGIRREEGEEEGKGERLVCTASREHTEERNRGLDRGGTESGARPRSAPRPCLLPLASVRTCILTWPKYDLAFSTPVLGWGRLELN